MIKILSLSASSEQIQNSRGSTNSYNNNNNSSFGFSFQPESPTLSGLSINSSPIYSPCLDSDFSNVFYPPPLDISGDSAPSDSNNCDDNQKFFSINNNINNETNSSPVVTGKNSCSICNRVIHMYLVSSIRHRRKYGSKCISCSRVTCFKCFNSKYYNHNDMTISNILKTSRPAPKQTVLSASSSSNSPSKNVSSIHFCIQCQNQQKKKQLQFL